MEKVDIVSLQGVISGIHNQMNGVKALKSVSNHSQYDTIPYDENKKFVQKNDANKC